MAKNQTSSTTHPIIAETKELQRALRLAAKNAQRLADAFGLKVPTAKTENSKGN